MEKKYCEEYAIGIDLGTSSCKTIILGKLGEVLGFASVNYEAEKTSLKWTEQNPEMLYNGLISSLIKAVQSSSIPRNKCLGISIGGALHSLVAINSKHKPLTGVMTWADMRSKKQSESLAHHFNTHDLYQRSGCPNNPMYPLSKIIWIREENRELFKQIYKLISAKEYVLWKLTGQEIVDYAIASGTGLFNITKLHWDDNLIDIAGINSENLSTPESPLTQVGLLDKAIMEKAGLEGSIPIILGSADAVNSSIGAGTTNSETLTCMIGTSGAIRTITHEPILDDQKRLWCYAIDGQNWLVGGAINNGGITLDWLRGVFNNAILNNREIDINRLINWASEIAPGADGLFCLPFLINERSPNWNPKMRAVLFGLTLQHDHRHIARSFLEGISFRLRSVLDAIQEVIGREDFEIKASGGFTKSSTWVQILTNILNQKLSIPSIGETSAVGAAFWVLLANRLVDNLDETRNLVKVTDIFYPDPDLQAVYDGAYQIYKDIYCSSREIFNKNSYLGFY